MIRLCGRSPSFLVDLFKGLTDDNVIGSELPKTRIFKLYTNIEIVLLFLFTFSSGSIINTIFHASK